MSWLLCRIVRVTWVKLTISCHAWLPRHTGWNEDDLGALQCIGELFQYVACDCALCVYVANISSNTCALLSLCCGRQNGEADLGRPGRRRLPDR